MQGADAAFPVVTKVACLVATEERRVASAVASAASAAVAASAEVAAVATAVATEQNVSKSTTYMSP